VSTTTNGRFDIPLYTNAEAARFLGVPTSTFATWAKSYVRRPSGHPVVIGEPIVTSMRAERGYPTVPFVGLAEAMIMAAFRRAGVSSSTSVEQSELSSRRLASITHLPLSV
jgi:hypothetical protein